MNKEYIARINQVVRYIEHNLASSFTLEELAGISAFSPHHFHRVFKHVMNENVFQFINRLRVEKISKVIVFDPDRSLTDVALECGLQSSAHLSRTFRRHTGLSASEYRKKYNLERTKEQFEQERAAANEAAQLQEIEQKYSNLKITIRLLPARQAACIHRKGSLIQEMYDMTVLMAFSKLATWMQTHDLLESDSQAIGLIFDDPCLTAQSMQRYAVSFTTSKNVSSSLEVQSITLYGGTYAVIPLAEPFHVLRELIHLVKIRWLPQSNFQWDESRHEMAIFQSTELSDPGDMVRLAFCIPVKLNDNK
ncbi:AraC family transcriptional regulator [Paenibacillus sp. PR3]|uniref:AraC family transcriptional regulator n=1 Tax=Paenibacillus terricola TaxID=2763503 RepID=A0ABR8MSY0_9BACL|nr:AraC family transcriptional regulator [Paenibacillus terricola]MBD3919088.1 AraC family transcriptional regulator [Paenibacillus terricola]